MTSGENEPVPPSRSSSSEPCPRRIRRILQVGPLRMTWLLQAPILNSAKAIEF